jgi:hypothetical protein
MYRPERQDGRVAGDDENDLVFERGRHVPWSEVEEGSD